MFSKIMLWRKTHRIELFGVCVGLVLLLMSAVVLNIQFKASREDAEYIRTKAVYVSSFTTSRSGVSGQIQHLFVNEARTKCGILVRVAAPAYMSPNADDYVVFVKGYNPAKGTYDPKTFSNPSGGYCIFGDTGYALIYLIENRGFGDQAIECIVRSNNTIHDSDEVSVQSDDPSYAMYDQYRIIVNPNAAEAEVVDFLDDLDASSLYQDVVMSSSEASIRSTLTQDVAAMNDMINTINSLRKTMDESYSIRVPDLPDEIAGDSFDVMTHPKTHEKIIVYTPGYVLAGGVDFDWFGWGISESGGFLQTLTGSGSAKQFLDELGSTAPTRSQSMKDATSGKDWVTKNGDPISLVTSANSSGSMSSTARAQVINSYISAVDSYYTLKQKYQCTDLPAYLRLEYEMTSMDQVVSGNFREGTIYAW